jgi:hypothetical protein
MQNRKYDLLTQVALAVLEGANAFVGVRVTDGTDVAASATSRPTASPSRPSTPAPAATA